jgi:tetratricopeptide (TPR) repeat protein
MVFYAGQRDGHAKDRIMSRKPNAPEKPLTYRIAKARKEGRTQQALELAHDLVKNEPTDANREVLRQAMLERGLHLQVHGSPTDAVTVYQSALAMGGTPEFIGTVAHRLASCGAVALALAAMQQLADPAVRQRILQCAVDAAVTQGPAGKSALPTEFHGGFDLVQQAVAHYEAGRDEDARAVLQGISLQSPFLEWKLFLRGLIAYAARDDARAVENWQRLTKGRLTFALGATMRAGIDPAFLASQPPGAQRMLRTRLMQHQGVASAPLLEEIKALLNGDSLGPAFRKAEQVVPLLRREHPDLAVRLGQCFFWTIVERGEPEDVERFRHVFGPPADDPSLQRLHALALEARGMFPEAHQAWQNLINAVKNNPAAWPGDSAPRVQALLWTRMAENASSRRKNYKPSGNPFFDLFASQPTPLKPTAEQCLENAIALAPDRLESYRALFQLYRSAGKAAKAKKIGQELLQRFPGHADTMAALGQLCLDTGDFKKAQEYFEKAIQANPLERSLRRDLARAKQNYGLKLTLESKFDKARTEYEQALPLWDGSKTALLCQWAVAEMKAKDADRAAALIAQANAEADHRLACRYALVGASVRARLPAKEKKQLAQELKDALADTPTPAEVLVLIESAAHQRSTHDDAFHGQKTQEKTILKFLDAVRFDTFGEAQLVRLCQGLAVLQSRRPWFRCLNHARRQFLKTPFFRLSYVDYYLMENSYDKKTDLAREHLDQARRLAEELPRGEEQEQLLEQIMERDQIIAEIEARNPSLMDVMERFFRDGPFDPDDDEGDEEDDRFW